jgi:hypothetical protein
MNGHICDRRHGRPPLILPRRLSQKARCVPDTILPSLRVPLETIARAVPMRDLLLHSLGSGSGSTTVGFGQLRAVAGRSIGSDGGG